jgi:aminoglycoside phosphotransferase (APT) family kinase protein
VQVGYPWTAAFEAGRPEPHAFLVRLIRETLRYGMPAKRYGRVGAWFVGNALPMRAIGKSFELRRKRTRPDIDRVLHDVEATWNELAGRAPRLPSRPHDLTALSLRRRSAETTFVFGSDPDPYMVCKTPRSSPDPLEREFIALREAEPAEVAPRALGRAGEAYVQEAIAGTPLEVPAVTPDNARHLPWSTEQQLLAEGLVRLAKATARDGPPQEVDARVKSALDTELVAAPVRKLASAALEELGQSSLAVLRHGDTSAQNCLIDDGRLSGLVDWEIARPQGAPAFDVLNAAVAIIDHGVGLTNWSEDRALESFIRAWKHSDFFRQARDAARRSTHEAGGTDSDHERLEIAFFARRLASRLAAPKSYATGPATAARMLEVACAH